MRLNKFLVFVMIMSIVKFVFADTCPISGLANFCGSADGQYTVTLKKIEFSTDGVNFITVGESSGTSFNIASMNVGSDFQSFISNKNIPAGTYNYIRITMSRTISFKGRTTEKVNGNYYYTSQATGTSPDPPYFPIAASCSDWHPGSGGCPTYDVVSIRIPDDAVEHHAPGETMEFVNNNQDARMTRKLSSPIVITEGQSKTLRIKFYTQGMVGFDGSGGNYIVFPLPPVQELSY